MGEVTTIGLDLAKNVFQIHGADETGRDLIRKQLRRVARTFGSGAGRSQSSGTKFD